MFGDREPINGIQSYVFSIASPSLAMIGWFHGGRDVLLFFRMRHFDEMSQATTVVVAEDENVDEGGDLRRDLDPRTAGDGGPVRGGRWKIETHVVGAPIYICESPPTIAALRGRRGHILPILSTGYPFGVSSEVLRSLGGELPEITQPDRQGVWRPELPAEFRVSPKMLELQRTFGVLVALVLVAFVGGALYRVGDDPGYAAVLFVFALILGTGFVVWCRTESRGIGPMRIDAREIEIASILGRTRVPWSEVHRVSVHGWNERLKRRQQRMSVVRSVVGLGIEIATGIDRIIDIEPAGRERRRSRTALRSAEPVDRALLLAGARETGIVPDVALFDASGRCLLRLKGTHSWKAAHALLSEAWARGASLD